MTYRDPDSGLEFASYDEYERERRGDDLARQPDPTDDEMCEASEHPYAGDHEGRGRCWCGAVPYPEGGGADDG